MASDPTIFDRLESDHSELDELLDAAMTAVDSADVDRAYIDIDLFWARLAMHIRAEHVRLFPAVLAAADESPSKFPAIPEVIRALHDDHDFFMRELARAIKAIRLVFDFGNTTETFAVVQPILESVKEKLDAHNRIEEGKIYTLATAEILGPTEFGRLFRDIEKELSNYPKRFANTST